MITVPISVYRRLTQRYPELVDRFIVMNCPHGRLVYSCTPTLSVCTVLSLGCIGTVTHSACDCCPANFALCIHPVQSLQTVFGKELEATLQIVG